MAKGISFQNKDKELVKSLENYQQENGLKSFTEAVRQVCSLGLDYIKLNEKANKGRRK